MRCNKWVTHNGDNGVVVWHPCGKTPVVAASKSIADGWWHKWCKEHADEMKRSGWYIEIVGDEETVATEIVSATLRGIA